MQRLAEFYKLQLGPERYKELLRSGRLPTDMLATEQFSQYAKALRTCDKHGNKATDKQVNKCFTC